MTATDVLDDPVRLRAVADLGLTDSPSQDRFDRITRTVGRVLDVPVSLLTLVTGDAVAVVATSGQGTSRSARELAFCTRVVATQQALLVDDATTDDRWTATGRAVGGCGAQAYAGVPLRGPTGQVVGTLCGLDVQPRRWTPADAAVLADLSRWAEAELARGDAERRRAQDELALARMKDELISVVSHELRTPLTGLKGALGLLTAGVGGALQPSGQQLARIALESADRLARLVDEICDLERLTAGQVDLERRPHSLADLVRAAAATVQEQATSAEVVLAVEVEGTTAWLDGARITVALAHLLGNAVRASPPGTTVHVRGRATQDGVVVEVEDHGCGIDPGDLGRVFEAFARGDSSDARRHGGAGLGLPLARSVVEAHGGRLSATSAVGHGTTFTVALPQRPSTRQAPA